MLVRPADDRAQLVDYAELTALGADFDAGHYLGRLHDGLRVIAEGLAPGETIVVSGLQRVRQGAEVKAEVVPMPSPSKPGRDDSN